MSSSNFFHRSETFGYDKGESWASDALRLLYSVPRAYQPLIESWNLRNPGTLKALERLHNLGFIDYQEAIIINMRTSTLASSPSKPLSRYKITQKGKRLTKEATTDIRVLTDQYFRLTNDNVEQVLALLISFDVEKNFASVGQSIPGASEGIDIPERTARWWVSKFKQDGYIKELEIKFPDTREVIPAHYRVTRLLSTQLINIAKAFPDRMPGDIINAYRLKRTRYLEDIDPYKIGINGATDYDHDINCQKILAKFIVSKNYLVTGDFITEPRISLPISRNSYPYVFSKYGDESIFYQPDAEIFEIDSTNTPVKTILEYERFQSRRDGWDHIEKFLGWVALNCTSNEKVNLRFVVDSQTRARVYIELIEAYATWAQENQDKIPDNLIVISVSTLKSVFEAQNPLLLTNWSFVKFEKNDSSEIFKNAVVHANGKSPYMEYFSSKETDYE